jgi:glutathione S-transferase
MIEIFGSFRSRARRVLWAALEVEAPFEHIPLSWSDPALKKEAFLQINPFGRIPALRDGSFTLSESLAINLYLARRFGRSAGGLYPEDPLIEARLWQWSHFTASELDPWVVNFGDHSAWLPLAQRSSVIASFCRASLQRSLAILETRLGQHKFLAVDHFTIADLNAAAVLQSIVPLDFSLDAFPATYAWLQASLARPAAIAARQYE